MIDPDLLGAGFEIAPDAFAALFEVGTQRVLSGLRNLCVIHGFSRFPVGMIFKAALLSRALCIVAYLVAKS